MSVDVLIFTKDRPAQLDLLLRSIETHAPTLYRTITIQWHASSPEYEQGYARVPPDNGLVTAWQRDHNPTAFREMVRAWLRGDHELISFLVDDDVFYRRFPSVFAINPIVRGISCRGGDYDYPFSLDGVIYRREWIEALLTGTVYGNPSQLEAIGDARRHLLPFETLEPVEPCLTGLPWNRVSDSSGMPHMGIHQYDLLERYLGGERLRLPIFAGSQPPHTTMYVPRWQDE